MEHGEGIPMEKGIDKTYTEVCKTYFPRWNPWKYTYNPDWTGGWCNTEQKHIYLGRQPAGIKGALSPEAFIIHQVCHAVGNTGHGKCWQNRMLKAANRAKRDNPKLSGEITAHVQRYRLSPEWSCREEIQLLYQRIKNSFTDRYPASRSYDIEAVLEYHLHEMGIRKEWDKPLFERVMQRGREIAETQSRLR
jgi:hypothetical protein